MMDFDASWCISCDRLIEPKRFQIAIPAPPTPTPAPPPSSPQASPTKSGKKAPKGPHRKGGLVHGTGRLRPNGSIKVEPTPPPPPTQPIRYRTVIDQSPQGVYCSDECRMDDLNSTSPGLPVYPDRDIPAVPTPSSSSSSSSSSSDASEGEDDESLNPNGRRYHPTILQMAKNYNFPPLPDLNKIYIDDGYESDCYTGGAMMAGRRIQATCPKPRKTPTSRWEPVEPAPKQIPGWTDGSQAWRVSAYNTGPLPSAKPSARSSRRTHFAPPSKPIDPTQELMANFTNCLTRRTESRNSSSSSSASFLDSRRERSLLPPGAEGKLLVPDVKLKVRSSSSSSIASGLNSPSGSRRSVRSPLSASSEDPTTSFPLRSKRPAPETRSWSYDNVKTYPLMPLPTTTVRRKEIQFVDGKEVEVIVEYEKPPQRLFLFPAPVRA